MNYEQRNQRPRKGASRPPSPKAVAPTWHLQETEDGSRQGAEYRRSNHSSPRANERRSLTASAVRGIPGRSGSTEESSTGSTFDTAVRRLVTLLLVGAPAGSSDLTLIIQTLKRIIGQLFSLSDADATDVADTAVLRFVEAVVDGRFQQDRDGAPYLVTVCRHAAIDHLRQARPGRVVPLSVPEQVREA